MKNRDKNLANLAPPNKYYDLGSFHRAVSTDSENAQTWFDFGLIWTYGFNHDEAVRCFEKAIDHDSGCAIAYWGFAYALGPNYNMSWDAFGDEARVKTLKRAYLAVTQAKALYSKATPVERALIDALQVRFQQETPPKDFSVWNERYADAMGSVYEDYSEDLDVAALYADSLMSLTPWKLWDLPTGKPAKGARTLEAKKVLERGFSQPGGLTHPGLLHLYIHLIEMSSTPEVGLTIADHLRGLVPDSGHLNHMPTHLDILCGDYRRAIASNLDAIKADWKFLAHRGSMNLYTMYRIHNYHFVIYAAMFSGQSRIALQTVAQLEEAFSEKLLRTESPPMANYLEAFMGMRVHVLIRFGLWQEMMDLEVPQNPELYCMTTALIYYGKGVAHAATGQITEANHERTLFQEAVKKVPDSRTLFNNTCNDVLKIAAVMLDGEISYREGNFDAAFESLRRSIALADTLNYDEPWGWMQPPRHAYGALLLEQGHVEEAATVYSADLGMDGSLPRALRHLNNVWALHGYHECLVRLGRDAEARIVAPPLQLALAIADVPIRSSCLCRL